MVQPLAQIPCPNCNSPISTHVHQVIDAQSAPQLKAELLSGRLNFVECPVCGYQGQLATPLVYHDGAKDLLLTFTPAEVSIDKNQQEKVVGSLINKLMDMLPAEDRKAYLFQPQQALTMQGFLERVLEADGVTKEDLDDQRAKLHLVEQLLNQAEDQLENFVAEHDNEMDEAFFQIAVLALQSVPDEQSRIAANHKLETAISFSTLGKKIQTQEEELRKAAESLRAIGDGMTREALLELVLEAPNEDRIAALVSLTRPAMDYEFFTLLSEQIDSAQDDEKERLEKIRSQLLEVTEKTDRAQEARAMQSATLLQSLIQAEDLIDAVQAALPMVDELFLRTLEANLEAARSQDDYELSQKLEAIQEAIQKAISEAIPPSLQLAQQVLESGSEDEAINALDQSSHLIDEQLLNALMATSQQAGSTGNDEEAQKINRLYRYALGLSMKDRMKEAKP